MFGMGLPEILIILVVALLVVGPSKLPDLARSLGKAFNEFRRMADEVKETLEEEVIKEEPLKEEASKEETTAQKNTQIETTADGENLQQQDVQAAGKKEGHDAKPVTHDA